MINAKGFFFPIEIYQGNTLDFDFEFILDNKQQTENDWAFIGAISNDQGYTLKQLNIYQHENGLFHVETEQEYVDLNSGSYTYEIKVVHKKSKRVSTLLRGSFIVYPSSLVNV